MGWEDRQYYRDQSRPPGARIWALLNGSVPLFTALGIRVRAHASLIVTIICVILFDSVKGYSIGARAVSMGMLGLMVLLHEFGHCFAARWMGGQANDILLGPLGGLAFVDPPRRPWPTFVTVVCGPLVNVLICVVAAGVFWAVVGAGVSLNPFDFHLPPAVGDLPYKGISFWTAWYLHWAYRMSYVLLLFNLLPIFPLDGGRMFQTALWPRLGHYRSMLIAYAVGMGGSIALCIFGLFHLSTAFLMMLIGISCFLYCRANWIVLKQTGPDEFGLDDGMDFSASLRPDPPPSASTRRRKRASLRAARRLRQEALEEQMLQSRIDSILAKVSAQGMQSLTWAQRRTLHKATARQRRREMELSGR